MTEIQIHEALAGIFPPESVYSQEIKINPHNHQIDQLKIIFKEDQHPGFKTIGKVMQALEDLVMDDEYGDMTELTFKYSTFEDLPGNALGVSYTFDINIDS